MSEETKGFTVRDRRHFAPDGTVRERDAAPGPSGSPGGASAHPAGPAESAEARDAGPVSLDFSGCLLSLGAQAGMLLQGEGGHSPDLAGARRVISILEMLEQKTEGRRTPQEQQVLEALLYELRTGYLERARAVGR